MRAVGLVSDTRSLVRVQADWGPKRDTRRPCQQDQPQALGVREGGSVASKMFTCESKSGISEEKLPTCHSLMVTQRDWFYTSTCHLPQEQKDHQKSWQGHSHGLGSCAAQFLSFLLGTDVSTALLFSAQSHHCSFSQDFS